jgi:predicted N-acyltransferase
MTDLRTSVYDGVTEIDADVWNRLVDDVHPFLDHGFLATLEVTGCVGPGTGWKPRILTVREADDQAGSSDDDDRLVGALPFYVKMHSAGEFVFDWGWADIARRSGIDYYPKGVVAVPFTPVTGDRLLVADDVDDPTAIKARLVDEALELAERDDLSSIHFNFVPEADLSIFESRGLPIRENYQYHWSNQRRLDESGGRYDSFDAFLGELRSKKRSNIKRERRKLRESGVETRIRTGDDVDASDLRRMFRYYERTIDKFFYGNQYLNEAFFVELGDRWSEHMHMVTAEHEGDEYAAAFNAVGGDALYGRYWGTMRDIDFTHFEVCFYSSIEWCIENGMRIFEGGSGGDHKFDRGFMPSITYSAHHVRDDRLSEIVDSFIEREATEIEKRARELRENPPFKQVTE